jgi:hypothetical protein
MWQKATPYFTVHHPAQTFSGSLPHRSSPGYIGETDCAHVYSQTCDRIYRRLRRMQKDDSQNATCTLIFVLTPHTACCLPSPAAAIARPPKGEAENVQRGQNTMRKLNVALRCFCLTSTIHAIFCCYFYLCTIHLLGSIPTL